MDYANAQEHSKRTGTYIDPRLGRVTLEAFWPAFLEASPHLAPTTRDLYCMLARRYLLPRLGNHRLGQITRPDVEAFILGLTSGGVGTSTAGAAYRLLHRVLAQAERADIIGRNPASGVRAPKPPHSEMRFLAPEQIDQLVAELPQRWRAFALVAAFGGLRFGELAALRIDRVDFLRRQVRVEEAYSEVGGRQILGPTKTRSKRQVALPRSVMEALASHAGAFPPNPDSLIFTNEHGGPVWRRGFRSRVWVPAVARAGLEPLRFHDLRHTSVALAIAAGAHPKVVQARAGHASITTTLDRYGHLFEGLDQALAERLEELFAPRLPHAPTAEVSQLRRTNA